MSHHTSTQSTSPVSDFTTSERASGTTFLAGLVVVGAVALSFPLWMFSLQALGATNDVLDQAEGMLWISFLLVPIACAGAYWLALFRLRRVKALRAWLEAFGFSLFYWLVMPVALGLGAYALQAWQLLNQTTAISPGALGGPWDTLTLLGKAPGPILYLVLQALMTSGIALGFAAGFARWDEVRKVHLKGRAWLEFLLVLLSSSVATLLAGLAFMYLTTIGLIPVLGALLAALAAWTTYRTLQRARRARPTSPGTVSGA